MRRRPFLLLVMVMVLLRRYWARASRMVQVLIRVVSGHGSDARGVQPACRCHGTAGPGGGNQQVLTDRQWIRADARCVERERRRQRGACAPGRERRWQLRLRQVLLLGARRCHRLAAAATRARHWQFQAWQHAWSFARWCGRGRRAR
jgi:hypothetical protein